MEIYKRSLDKIKRLKANIKWVGQVTPIEKKHVPKEDTLKKIYKALPYYILKYSDDAIRFLEKQLGAPFPLNYIYDLLEKGIEKIQKRYFVK